MQFTVMLCIRETLGQLNHCDVIFHVTRPQVMEGLHQSQHIYLRFASHGMIRLV